MQQAGIRRRLRGESRSLSRRLAPNTSACSEGRVRRKQDIHPRTTVADAGKHSCELRVAEREV